MRLKRLAGAGLLAALSVNAAEPVRVTGAPMAAVWQEQHLNFAYAGRTARYSCEGLRDKLRALLLEMGVRRDLKLATSGCDSGGISVDLVFSAPALPAPDRRPRHAGDLAAAAARFERFTLTSDAFRNFGSADCELVEEFARQILPKLAAREVRQDITCVPYQRTGSHYLVQGEILRSLPAAERALGGLRSP